MSEQRERKKPAWRLMVEEPFDSFAAHMRELKHAGVDITGRKPRLFQYALGYDSQSCIQFRNVALPPWTPRFGVGDKFVLFPMRDEPPREDVSEDDLIGPPPGDEIPF